VGGVARFPQCFSSWGGGWGVLCINSCCLLITLGLCCVCITFSVLWSLLRSLLLPWVYFPRFCGSGGQFGASLGPDLAPEQKKLKKSPNFDHFFTKYWLQRGAFLHPWRPRGRLGAPFGGLGVPKWSPRGSKLYFKGILKTVLLLRVFSVF